MELSDRARRLDLALPIGVKGRDSSGADFHESGVTVNVSSSAVCFETAGRHEIGAAIEVEIALPEELRRHFGGRETYRARCLVYRVEPAGERWRTVARFAGVGGSAP